MNVMNTSRTLPEKATRNHIGYNKHYDRMKRKTISNDFRSLVVRGTMDKIKPMFLVSHKQKEHPTDKGYYKEVLTMHPDRKYRLEVLRKKYLYQQLTLF